RDSGKADQTLTMKNRLFDSKLLIPAFVLTLAAGACAGEAKSGNTDRQDRPPLKLNIDRKPIDRNAADRVSYAPIVEKTADSVVYVYSTKQVRAREMAPFLDDPILRR